MELSPMTYHPRPPQAERKKCRDCIFRCWKYLPPDYEKKQLYCCRYRHWLEEDTCQITVPGNMDFVLCDYVPKIHVKKIDKKQ